MVATYIVQVLVASGAATAAAIALFLAPSPLLRLMFGTDCLDDRIIFLSRYVGLLVFLFGCLIVYSAVDARIRMPVLIAASVEKTVFAGLVLLGKGKRTPVLGAAAIADIIFTVLYVLYLFGS